MNSGGVWESLHDSIKCRKLIETMDETSKFIPRKFKNLVASRITHHANYLLQDAATKGTRLLKASIFLIRLNTKNLNIVALCLRYNFNFIRMKLGKLKSLCFD